ncbi:MAG: inorganic diphosphatase [Bacteroidia bacterium]
MTNLLSHSSMSDSGNYNAVIEIPAGTNLKTEINKETGVLEASFRNGQPRVIDFLGYPVNYGFVPSTFMDKNKGGDGDPIDALIICESLPLASIIEFIPIAVLRLKDKNELDSKIIGIPVNPKLRTIRATNFVEFITIYPAIMDILVLWFLNYDKRHDNTKFIAWENEAKAFEEIEKWRM